LEDLAEAREVLIRNEMGGKSELLDIQGNTLITWRNSKPAKKFDTTLFKQAMPDIYEKFVIEQPGSRRFLVK